MSKDTKKLRVKGNVTKVKSTGSAWTYEAVVTNGEHDLDMRFDFNATEGVYSPKEIHWDGESKKKVLAPYLKELGMKKTVSAFMNNIAMHIDRRDPNSPRHKK